MEVNGKQYRFSVTPYFGHVLAEVYRVTSSNVLKNEAHIFLTSKKFGRWYGGINDQDYKDARRWAERHIINIYSSNKEQL